MNTFISLKFLGLDSRSCPKLKIIFAFDHQEYEYDYEFFPPIDKARAREPVSFWRENEIAAVIFSLCENDVVAKTSPRNVGDLVFFIFGISKGLSYQHSRQLGQVRRSQRVK